MLEVFHLPSDFGLWVKLEQNSRMAGLRNCWRVIQTHQIRVGEHHRKTKNVNATCAKRPLTKVNKDSNCSSQVKVARPVARMLSKKLIVDTCSPRSGTLWMFRKLRRHSNLVSAFTTSIVNKSILLSIDLWWWQSLTDVWLLVSVKFSWFTNMIADQGSCI